MRVGVIGVGGHAAASLYPNLGAAGLELVATCARRLERAEAAAAKWGAPHAFDDACQMLSSVEIDGVIICVDPASYGPLVSLCLEASKPVFCEKPAAASSDEAAELAELSARTEVPVVVGYMKRFAPAYQRAREIVLSEDFGPQTLGTFTFAMGQGWDADLRTYLMENPVHHLDLARYFLGELSDLQAQVAELPGFGHAVAATAKSSSGAVCTFNLCNTASWQQRNEHIEVYGKGHAVWVDNVDTCTYRPTESPEQTWRPNYTVPQPQNFSSTIMGFVPELEHFRAVATERVENLSDMASAGQTLALAEQLCEITAPAGQLRAR